MLVLTRKIGEQIVIGEGPHQVVATVVDIRGDKVRLGFDAARDVAINRLEVHLNNLAREKAAAETGCPASVVPAGSGPTDRRLQGAGEANQEA